MSDLPNSKAVARRLRLGWSAELATSAPRGSRRRGGRMGDGCVRPDGYRTIQVDGRAVLEHIAIAEHALGRRIGKPIQVHHVNENRSDNRPENLVICPNAAYHALLHLRADALHAGCPADWRRCAFCGQHDDPIALRKWGRYSAHLQCRNKHQREYRARLKEEACRTPN